MAGTDPARDDAGPESGRHRRNGLPAPRAKGGAEISQRLGCGVTRR